MGLFLHSGVEISLLDKEGNSLKRTVTSDPKFQSEKKDQKTNGKLKFIRMQ